MLINTKPLGLKIALYDLLQIVTNQWLKDHKVQPIKLDKLRLCSSLAWQVNLPLALKTENILC